ncbi:cvnh domain-containing protein [Colletotrichum kahawae]|uniref:Cvnh domain-containing protein n=1 Tax=Colletotrichum kahawae TaxID=34407 RepID=A0AAD9XW72_COLKA|nr:cvnh domain-containing protein [Colletotrichum kahawae]
MNLRAATLCLLGGLPLLIDAGNTSITNGADGLKTTVIKTTITTTATVPASIKNTHLANTTHLTRHVWWLPTDLPKSKVINSKAKLASPKTAIPKTVLSKALTPLPSAINIALASPNSTITHTTPSLTVVDITATGSRSPLDDNILDNTDGSLTPASDPAAGFIKTCSAWQVWDANNALWARCRARGRGTLYWSRIGLDHMLGNVGGRLVYQREGYFSSSCVSCQRRARTNSYLQCECKDNQGEFQTTSIDLNRYLGNRDGFICSEYMCGVREGPPPGSRK